MYKKITLPNKMRIVTCPMRRRDSASVGIWIGTGGRYEDDRLKGAAHFLEHILFKGSRKYSCDQIKKLIEGVGGTLNAFTAEECTCYYAKVPGKYLDKTFDILADMVSQPLIAKRDVDKERTVILEEIKMYHDLPQHLVIDLLDGLMWPGHPLGKSLAGTFESVGAMSYRDLRHFHRSQYASGSIVVAAAGCLEHRRLVSLAGKKFSGIKPQSNPGYMPVTHEQKRAQVRFFRKDIEQMHVALGAHGLRRDHADRHAINLLSIIMGGNMSSRLFDEVREKRGLAYAIGSAVKYFHDTGAFVVRAGVDNTKIVEALKVITAELAKICARGATPNEFKRAKDYYIGQVLLGLEDTLEHMLWVGEPMVSLNRIHTLTEILAEVKRVSIGDIKRIAATVLRGHRYNVSVVGPLTDAQERAITALFAP